MIKVNLLDSVTDRAKGVAAVETRVSSPKAQTLLLAVVVAAILGLGMAYDYMSARGEHSNVEAELVKQNQIKDKMKLVLTEQADLEKKNREVESRINAIQKLRASQQGPSAILSEIKERVETIPGLYLESVEQKGNDLIIRGGSPNETSVTRLGQSLEFAGSTFSNLSIETERKPADVIAAPGASTVSPGTSKEASAQTVDLKVERPEIVNFVIKCAYAPRSTQPSNPTPQTPPSNQIAQK
jgi:Tfp pilus assembly protein PilN